MAKRPQKTPRSSRPTRAERHVARKKEKKEKKGKASEKQPPPSLKAQVGGGKGAPKVGRELSKPQNSRPQSEAKKAEGERKQMSEGEQVPTPVKQDLRMAQCPACGDLVELPAGVKKGSQMECPECGEQLEVISLRPPEFDYALGHEDWAEEWEE